MRSTEQDEGERVVKVMRKGRSQHSLKGRTRQFGAPKMMPFEAPIFTAFSHFWGPYTLFVPLSIFINEDMFYKI